MMQEAASFEPHYWLLDQPPCYSRVWLFKSNRVGGHGDYRSQQLRPSGVTLRIVTGGRWRVWMCGKQTEAGYGDVFLALPSEPIEFRQQDENADWEWYELQFNGDAAETFVGEFGLRCDRPVVTPKKPRAAVRLFKYLYELMGREDREVNMAMAAVLRLTQCCGGTGPENGVYHLKSGPALVKRAITILENDPSSHLNVSEIAQRLGVDRTTLGRAFKTHTGNSPHHFIESYRMMKVRELLQNSTLPIHRIAAAAGFGEVKYFINWFHSRTGQAPGRWRAALRSSPPLA